MGHGHQHHHHGLDGLDRHDHAAHAGGRARDKNRKRLLATLILTLAYMVAEVVGGLWTNSLALLADAGHMLSDAGALALSLFAIWIARRPANPRRTYGYYRVEILAALVNASALFAIAILIVAEAVGRVQSPPEVRAPGMMAIAAGGLVINLLGLWILSGGRNDSLNVRGAWLHVLTDALGSVGAMVSAGLIAAFGWRIVDPIASMVIAALVLYSSWPLLQQALSVLMESAPSHIDVDEVHAAMSKVPGVVEVHDLHVWTITTGLECLSGHVVASRGTSHQDILRNLRQLLHERFGIDHVTIQMEDAGFEELAICANHSQSVRELP